MPSLPDSDLISPPANLAPIDRLRAIMHRLRAPGGCPWDIEQSHESLIPNLIEESHEVIDTIRRRDDPHLEEELGDLLLQVVFHAEMGSERQAFDFDSIASAIATKLVRRHPHIFASAEVDDSEAVLRQWDEIKRQEKANRPPSPNDDLESGQLGDAGKGLPGLLAATKIQKKAAKVGFDWPESAPVIDKIREELAEVEAELVAPKRDPNALRAELGDLLFSVVNLCRHLDENPEECLELTNQKFRRRFRAMERALEAAGSSAAEANLNTMETAWQAAK